jgi:hypothetical protein
LKGGQLALTEMVDLTTQGEELARQLIDIPHQHRSPSFLWQQAEAIRSIDPKLHRLMVGYPEIASFIEHYFQEQRSSDEEIYVNILARQLAETYRTLHQAGNICLQVLEEFIRYSPVLSQHISMLSDMAHLVQQASITDTYQPTEVVPCK